MKDRIAEVAQKLLSNDPFGRTPDQKASDDLMFRERMAKHLSRKKDGETDVECVLRQFGNVQ